MNDRRLAFQRGSPAPEDAGAASPVAVADADAPPDIRAALRHATASLHQRLDGAPEQRALLAPAITLAQYASIMTKHHRALAVCEAVLAGLETARPSDLAPYRPRRPALEADLATLGAPVPATDSVGTGAGATSAQAPAMDAEAARGRYLGTRYVLEGSTQGAVMIARRLEGHLPALGARAFGYWRLQAEEAPTWKVLAATLAALPPRGPMAAAAIAGAREAFGAFLDAFGVDAPDSSPAEASAGARARSGR